MSRYDYLVVGAGLFGAVFAHEAAAAGRRCLVIDRRDRAGGNAATETVDGIQVHRYGAHIFHTSDPGIWAYVQRFASFRPFVNAPLAMYHGKVYHLPFNMNTFYAMWGVTTPEQARGAIAERTGAERTSPARNLEELALQTVGRELYETLIRGYTEKQWGKPCSELPPSILGRLPLRFTWDNNYFSDRWQGIPEEGYTRLAERLLEGCDVCLGVRYEDVCRTGEDIATKTVYTGPIDAFFGYRLGHLAYRSLRFATETLPQEDFQGNAVVNYTQADIPWTRILEHKHFLPGRPIGHTVITREYPQPWTPEEEPYYPLNDAENDALYARYRELAARRPDVLFGGRLGTYRYLNMDETIADALALAHSEQNGGERP